ncbi:MAG: AAA family ATPase, partial [Spirochaetales bacterium]|nr:AAA family ATPase [Spirochaetales bacterium]
MRTDRLYIVMVGLPARGKSTIASKIKDDLKNDSIKTKIFNNGDLRRRMIPSNTSYAEFYDPKSIKGASIRNKIAKINLKKAKSYLNNNGNVAIIDATNASLERRKLIQSMLDDYPILYVECINNDQEILIASIRRKIETSEFGHLTRDNAIKSFKKRISYYMHIYTPLKFENNYIKLDSLNKKVIAENIKDDIPFYDQIRDFLVTDTLKHLYLIRHGET